MPEGREVTLTSLPPSLDHLQNLALQGLLSARALGRDSLLSGHRRLALAEPSSSLPTEAPSLAPLDLRPTRPRHVLEVNLPRIHFEVDFATKFRDQGRQ